MGKKKFAKEPLLYIHQPSIGKPEAKMQYDYSTQQKAQPVIASEEERGNTSIAKKRGDFLEEEQRVLEEIGQDKEKGKDKEVSSFKEQKEVYSDNKPFKEMDIQEKAAYLAETPKFTPKKKCEVKMEDRRFRGTITEVRDGTVYMRTGNRSRELTIREITDIRMIGF
ncbi:CotO family spore coat protein [Virgibacillus xinjiangensis]|uniref:CotO family spore coat protein n=1 Tax=Virgibacillus xinjiangensis TaxID=393090 RepID=A0ABV7CWU1_9BACI